MLNAHGTAAALCSTAALLLLGGCGDSDTVTMSLGPGNMGNESADDGDEPNEGSGDTQGEPSDGSSSADAPVYFMTPHVLTNEEWTSYLSSAVAERAADLTTFDPLEGALELGPGYAIPVAHDGAVYLADPAAPQITRYVLGSDGRFTVDKVLSFAGVGVTSVADFVFVNASKAYLFDSEGQRAIVWDPTEMILTGAQIAMPSDTSNGFPFWWFDRARVAGDRLYVSGSLFDADRVLLPPSPLLVIDTRNDSVVNFAVDDRCQAFHVIIEAAGGALYFFPDAEQARLAHTDLEPEARRPVCSLRVLPGAEAFDPDFVLDLTALVGGDTAAGGTVQGAIPDGKGGLYFAVLDDERSADPETYDYKTWVLWHYDFVTAAPLTENQWWSAAMSRWYESKGEVYAVDYAIEADGTEVTLIYDAKREPWAPFSIRASLEPFVRLR